MKKILLLLTVGLLLSSCNKDSLELFNPNEPGFETLKSESGIERLALGVYRPLKFYNGYYYFWFVLTNHNIMGDATVVSAGNFGWRWANQVTSVTLSDNTVLGPPVGGTQPVELDARNTRDFLSDNVQSHEWMPMYGVIGHVNFLMSQIDDVVFTGTPAEIETKKKTLRAWGYWWKGFAYSRLGSMYTDALIVDQYGSTNPNYVDFNAIIAEAARNFEAAKAELTGIPETDASYLTLINRLIPSYLRKGKGGTITPQMFIRNINTYLARNILVNKAASQLTTADLTSIENLANNGINSSDRIFTVRSMATEDLVYETAWSPWRLLGGWEWLSERLVQDFRPGDARRTRNIIALPSPRINPNGRGVYYGTRWTFIRIENGGDWVSQIADRAEMPIGSTFEENQLMLAEVKIRRGEIEAGLAHVDAVRASQNAGLAPTVGQNLTQAQALEELRSERRIGLFLKGTAFYDARRWGILRPVSQGGGRSGAVVLTATGAVDAGARIDYNFKERFDVPANETDFNPKPAPVAAIGSIERNHLQ